MRLKMRQGQSVRGLECHTEQFLTLISGHTSLNQKRNPLSNPQNRGSSQQAGWYEGLGDGVQHELSTKKTLPPGFGGD